MASVATVCWKKFSLVMFVEKKSYLFIDFELKHGTKLEIKLKLSPTLFQQHSSVYFLLLQSYSTNKVG